MMGGAIRVTRMWHSMAERLQAGGNLSAFLASEGFDVSRDVYCEGVAGYHGTLKMWQWVNERSGG